MNTQIANFRSASTNKLCSQLRFISALQFREHRRQSITNAGLTLVEPWKAQNRGSVRNPSHTT